MNYLTEYYKNKCEQLQERLSLLEANYLRALRSGDPDLMRQQLMLQQMRSLQATDQKETMRALADQMKKLSDNYPQWEKMTGLAQMGIGREGARESEHEENIQTLLQALAPIIGNKYENPDEFAASRAQQQNLDTETMQAVRSALSRMAAGNQQAQMNVMPTQY